LVLRVASADVVFAGGLVFAERAPTTPHADLNAWQQSLDALGRTLRPTTTVVPSHGPVHRGLAGAEQTATWLRWVDTTLRQAAQAGWDMNEVLYQPLPAAYAAWAANPAEWQRTVAQLYPGYERAALAR
jgi:glyoxylase-like metal-dependent hydrolase (beta-lactamase superfamily II)